MATKKLRSPSFPFINLEMAIARARTIYNKESQHAIPRVALVSHWGYAEKSSGGLQTIGALVSFKLLEKTDTGDFKITREGLQIILDEEARTVERTKAIQFCALAPKLYARLWNEYRWPLPSDVALRSKLVLEFGMQEKAIPVFLKNYKSTIEFAQLDQCDTSFDECEDGRPGESPALELPESSSSRAMQVGDYVQWESQGVYQFREPMRIREVSEHDGEPYILVDGHQGGFPISQARLQEPQVKATRNPVRHGTHAADPTTESLRFRLSEGVSGEITLWGRVTRTDIESLIAMMELQKEAFPSPSRAEAEE